MGGFMDLHSVARKQLIVIHLLFSEELVVVVSLLLLLIHADSIEGDIRN
jgi:hypothetical protein